MDINTAAYIEGYLYKPETIIFKVAADTSPAAAGAKAAAGANIPLVKPKRAPLVRPSYQDWLKKASPELHYDAVSEAEHTATKGSRFIRANYNQNPGTTAYGPVQLNKGYLQDYAPGGRYEKILSNEPELSTYLKGLITQADKFALHGNNRNLRGYDKNFDYINRGGTGIGDMGNTPEQQELYKKLAIKMMQHRTAVEYKGDWNKYLQKHRGMTREQDPRYYEVYDSYLQNKYNEELKRQAQQYLNISSR
jgi:hypothetical protein